MLLSTAKSEIRKKALEKRRKTNRLRNITGIFSACLLVGSFVLLLNLNFFRLTKITVTGETAENKNAIQNAASVALSGRYAYLVPKNSVFFFSAGTLAGLIKKQFPRLSTVAITRTDPQSLSLALADKEAKLLWCSTNEAKHCYYLDGNGRLYSEAPSFSDNILLELSGLLPANPLGQSVIASSSLASILALSQLVSAVWPKTIASSTDQARLVNILSGGDLEIIMANPDQPTETWKIIFNENNSLTDLTDNLNSVLANKDWQQEINQTGRQLDYLDLRFGQKVFYKFK